ncbi:MAG: redoxin domain-containing protein [Flavobacteriales bacterium]|nr:redoxin domain-containing protein [Flavobacteriales bacterium]
MRFLLFLFVVPFLASGQYATIRGVAPLAIGQEIQLRVNDDPVSGKERVLAKQTVDVDGSFELKPIVSDKVQYAILQVGQNCADFFMERDKDLELSFVPPAKDPNKPEAFYQRHFFVPKILGGKSAKLNQQIIAFNDTLDGFLEAIYPVLVNRKSPSIVSDGLKGFEKAVSEKFRGAEPFVQEYIKYSIAGVEQTFLNDRERLYQKYLKGVQTQFNNPAFTDFLLQFYQGEVYKMAMVNKHEECKKLLDGKEAFAKMDEMLLAQEPKLQDVSVRRLVLIAGMEELFGQKDFEDEELITALKHFGMLSSNSYLGNAAMNVAAKHEMLSNGTLAPDIVFKDLNGTEKNLSDFQGTYVFLELTDATNGYCQRETNVIPNLKDEFRNIRFVTVCVGNSEAEMRSLQRQMNINWEFGGVEMSSSIMEDYDIKSLPLFFIIDPDGKFYSVPAKEPSRGAQGELMSLSEKLKAKGRSGVGK